MQLIKSLKRSAGQDAQIYSLNDNIYVVCIQQTCSITVTKCSWKTEARSGGAWFNDSEAVVRAFLSGTLLFCSDPPDCLKGPNTACPECLLCLPVMMQSNCLPPTQHFFSGMTKMYHPNAVHIFTMFSIPFNIHLAFHTCYLSYYRICPLSKRVLHFGQKHGIPKVSKKPP